MKKRNLHLIGICTLGLNSCAYLINSWIYENKCQKCTLYNWAGNAIAVYESCGSDIDDACEECEESVQYHPDSYCSCSIESRDD
ncbi:MAG: hypothetical protein MI810_13235 [Flavobacteriales bacterium]|nr:hypothetical protein [Flavobacteriales bacterium]